jgi:hypothetical protein
MSFTENLYLKKQLEKLQEENLILKQILEQSLPMDQEVKDMRVRRGQDQDLNSK